MSEKEEKKENTNWLLIGSLIGLSIFAVFLIYTGFILGKTWPISEYSIDKASAFGDSFGPLTCLFSGFAFAGMVVAILMQKEELKLQRNELQYSRVEFTRSAEAQERSVGLTALNAIYRDQEFKIEESNEVLKKLRQGKKSINTSIAFGASRKTEERENTLKSIENYEKYIIFLKRKKTFIAAQIENFLLNSGVDLPQYEDYEE